MAAMLVYRTIAEKVFWEFEFVIMQNLSDILLSHHLTENQEYVGWDHYSGPSVFLLIHSFLPYWYGFHTF